MGRRSGFSAVVGVGGWSCAQISGRQTALASREAFDIAVEAYIFGYPLVTMDLTRRVMTNAREPEGMRAPLGQFARVRTLPLASSREVTVPNADTLYTGVWLDVAREPWVLSLPEATDRYCLFPMLDGWTTVSTAPAQADDRRRPAEIRHHWPRLERQIATIGVQAVNRMPAAYKAWEVAA